MKFNDVTVTNQETKLHDEENDGPKFPLAVTRLTQVVTYLQKNPG